MPGLFFNQLPAKNRTTPLVSIVSGMLISLQMRRQRKVRNKIISASKKQYSWYHLLLKG